MGFRFRKSFKVAPGVKLNLGKKSAGVSFGGKGFRTSVSSSGRKTTSVGVPGTGLSYVSTSGGSSSSKSKSSKGSTSSMNSSKKGGCWVIFAPLLIILFLIGGIGSCLGGDDETTTTVASSTGIEEIEFYDSDPLQLYIGDTEHSHVEIECDDDFTEDDVVFVSSDESIVTVSLSSATYSNVYYKIEAIAAGTATVHAETSDGIVKSEEITVTVLSNKITGIKFSNKEALNLEVGATKDGYVDVDYDGNFTENDIIFVSSDESVVTIALDISGYSKVHYDIKAISAGTAAVYAQSADGTVKSDEIMVTVYAKETINTEKIIDNTTKKNASTTEDNKNDEYETVKANNGRSVYRTPSGKRYHFDSECGGKNAYSVSLDDAKSSGLTPCQKCAQ